MGGQRWPRFSTPRPPRPSLCRDSSPPPEAGLTDSADAEAVVSAITPKLTPGAIREQAARAYLKKKGGSARDIDTLIGCLKRLMKCTRVAIPSSPAGVHRLLDAAIREHTTAGPNHPISLLVGNGRQGVTVTHTIYRPRSGQVGYCTAIRNLDRN